MRAVRDPASGINFDPAKQHVLNHKGKHFQVRGPLSVERPPWGDPPIIQAGGSEPGQELSARTADIVFSVVSGDPDAAKTSYETNSRAPRPPRTGHELAKTVQVARRLSRSAWNPASSGCATPAW